MFYLLIMVLSISGFAADRTHSDDLGDQQVIDSGCLMKAVSIQASFSQKIEKLQKSLVRIRDLHAHFQGLRSDLRKKEFFVCALSPFQRFLQ